jgi:hypothetical protein
LGSPRASKGSPAISGNIFVTVTEWLPIGETHRRRPYAATSVLDAAVCFTFSATEGAASMIRRNSLGEPA